MFPWPCRGFEAFANPHFLFFPMTPCSSEQDANMNQAISYGGRRWKSTGTSAPTEYMLAEMWRPPSRGKPEPLEASWLMNLDPLSIRPHCPSEENWFKQRLYASSLLSSQLAMHWVIEPWLQLCPYRLAQIDFLCGAWTPGIRYFLHAGRATASSAQLGLHEQQKRKKKKQRRNFQWQKFLKRRAEKQNSHAWSGPFMHIGPDHPDSQFILRYSDYAIRSWSITIRFINIAPKT